MNIEEQIKKILGKCYEFGFDGQITSGIGDDKMVRYTCVFNETRALELLSTLIKESQEEAVIGFGNWLEDKHTDYGYVAMSDFGYEYLKTQQSLDGGEDAHNKSNT